MSLSTLVIAQASGQGSLLNALVPPLLILVIFYFLLFAPMRKRQKALQALIDALKKGDRVVTNGGIHGEVYALEEKTVLLKVADNVRIKVARSAIGGIEGQEE